MAAPTPRPLSAWAHPQQVQQPIRECFGKLEGEQERRAVAAEAMAKNYALKLDVVKQVGGNAVRPVLDWLVRWMCIRTP